MIKKNIVKLIIGVLLAILACLFVACNGQDSSTATEAQSETGAVTESETQSESESENDGESEEESESEEETGCFHPYEATHRGHWKPACSVCGKGEGKVQSHEFAEYSEDEGDLIMYSSYCKVCDYVAYEQEVPYEINLFYSAGEMVKGVTQGFTASYGYDLGSCYAAYSSEIGGGVAFIARKGEVSVKSGSIMVLKVRVPASQNSLTLTIKSASSSGNHTVTLDYLESGWITAVIDLSKVTSKSVSVDSVTGILSETVYGYTPDAFGDYYLEFCSLGAKAGEGETFDVSYVLFCDTMDVAKEFVKNEKKLYVYNDIMTADPIISSVSCLDKNGNEIKHLPISNAEGHTIIESCDQCGIKAVENEAHTFVQTKIGNSVTYACRTCGWLQFGCNISKYFSATEINSGACTYYRVNTLDEPMTEDGVEFASFSGNGNTGQVIFARNNNVSTDAEEAAAFGVGISDYLVIKMRASNPEVSFSIKVRTAVGVEMMLRLPLAKVEEGEWAVYVAKLSDLLPEAFVSYSNGKYLVTDFYLHIGSTDFTSSVKFDISYIAFFDNWNDMAEFVDSETVVNVNGDNAGSLVYTENKTCVEEHSPATRVVDGKYILECTVCSQVQKTYEVKESVERFLPAEQLVTLSSLHGSMDRTLLTENGVSFVRINNFKTSHLNWGGWTIISDNKAPVTGKYLVIKVRIGQNGLSQSALEIYLGTENVLDAGMLLSISVSEDNQWHTFVIDLSKRIADPENYFKANDDGTYSVRYLQIRPFSKKQTAAKADDYMDISYIAFCDDLSDLKDVIEEPSYEWSVDASSNSIRYTENSGCVTHMYKETVSGTLHIVSCPMCMTEIRRFEVNKSVNWYVDFSSVSIYQHSVEKYLEESGVSFSRFTGSGGNEIYLTYDPASGKNVSANSVSTGRYFIIKYRGSSSDSRLTLSLQFATGSSSRTEMGIQSYANIPHSEWRVAIIDLSSCPTYECSSDGKINIMLRVGGSPANYTVDVAYAAIVDSISEASGILSDGEKYYDYGGDFSSSGVQKTFSK